ncbi:amidase family protein [Streptomyces sp. NPDC096311]|uniref:amidase family protein n=1 Tax=Streptomyces sp. NPDC096311 TaxID=3366083 RepID=UPI00383078CA
MTTPDLRCPPGVPSIPARPTSNAPVRITIVRSAGTVKNHPAVDQALSEAAARLADAGYEVDEAPGDMPLLAEAHRLWTLLVLEDFRTILPIVEELGDDAIRTVSKHYFAAAATIWGEQPSLPTYINGWARRGLLIRRLQELLGSNRMLLTPVSAELPFEQDADLVAPERTAEILAAQWAMTSVPILGFPAVSVPTTLTDGLPIGVQLIGGRFEEDLLLDAAQAIEERTPLFRSWT